MNERHALGQSGERSAADYLQSKGLRLLERGFQTRYGEIDAILKDGETWVFLEVKTRLATSDYAAVDSITRAKKKRIVNAAVMYIKKHRLEDQPIRFDVVVQEGLSFEWIQDAFQPELSYTL